MKKNYKILSILFMLSIALISCTTIVRVTDRPVYARVGYSNSTYYTPADYYYAGDYYPSYIYSYSYDYYNDAYYPIASYPYYYSDSYYYPKHASVTYRKSLMFK